MLNNNLLKTIPQKEWDAMIYSILRPFLNFCYSNSLISKEDLTQEAWLGLLSACEHYDPTKSKFTTFAYHYIRGYIMNFINKRLTNEDLDGNIIESFYEESHDDLIETITKKLYDQKQLNILIDHFVNNKSYRTIAKEQNMSHEMVGVHIRRMLDLLSKRLKHENAPIN